MSLVLHTLPLYPGTATQPIEGVRPFPKLDPECSRCQLGAGKRKPHTVCIPAMGQKGGVLFVGEYPGRDEDAAGRPFVGSSGKHLRATIGRYWKGPVALDNAIRCSPGSGTVTEKHVEACRGYLAKTLADVQPTRIVAVGSTAFYSLLGRKPPVLSVRRGVAWLSNGVPVFMLPNPAAAMRNKFVNRWFLLDMKWALTTDVSALPAVPANTVLRLVSNAEEAERACAELADDEWFAYDCETYGKLHWDGFRIPALAACGMNSESPWVWDEEAMEDPARLEPLKQLMANPNVWKVGHNLKYDMHAFRCATGVKVEGAHGDTRLWRKLLFGDADGHLDVCAELVGMGGHKGEAKKALVGARESLRKAMKRAQGAMLLPGVNERPVELAVEQGMDAPDTYAYGLFPRDVLIRYNARDALATARLGRLLEPQVMRTPALRNVWTKLLRDATSTVAQIETWGMPVEKPALHHLAEHLAGEEVEAVNRLRGFGFTKNPNHPASIAEFLYDDLGLPCSKIIEGSGARSTDKDALETLEGKHDAVDALIHYRTVQRLRTTYAEGMLPHVTPHGRIHPSLKIDGARSGRFSCERPNLQNIPREKKGGIAKMCKDVFVAPPGFTFLQADFSQLELRVAAMLSQDPKMIQIFKSGQDYHLKCAKLIGPIVWGVAPELITKESEYRSKVKNFVFGLLYGMGDNALAKHLGSTKAEAARIRQAVLGEFTKLAAWIRAQILQAKRTGEVYTWWDGHPARRRSLYRIDGPDEYAASVAEHGAFNSPCQGTAADFCLASLNALVRWILEEDFPAKVVITVHDSILLEVQDDYIDEAAFQMQRIMTSWNSAGVPLKVDLQEGRSWGSMVDYKMAA